MTVREELEEMYRQILPTLKKHVVAGQLVPSAFVLKQDAAVAMYALPFESEDQKCAMAAIIDGVCAKVRARGLIFCSEIWMAPALPGAPLPESVEALPERTEALMVMLMTHGWSEARVLEIRRGDGDAVEFGAAEQYAGGARLMLNYFAGALH